MTTIGPALGQGAVMNQATSYDAISARRAWTGFERGEGVATYGSFRVSQRGAGANMSVDVNMDDGAWVRGDAVTLQALYYVSPHASTINEAITAAHATLPRIDQVVLEIKDHAHDASGLSLAQTRVVDGTPTGGATLDNRTGAAALPSSALLLADVLVAATDTSITDAEIRDRRAFVAGVPPLLTDVDMAPLAPVGINIAGFEFGAAGGAGLTDLEQAAVLVRLDRRIAGATRVRWKHEHGSPALAGDFVLAIYDSSGRKIVDTGATAFSGAINTVVVRSVTIAATTFEPGLYYAFIGLDISAGTGGALGAVLQNDPTITAISPAYANVALVSASGGTTPPTTLLGMTDVGAATALLSSGVPLVSLSVG